MLVGLLSDTHDNVLAMAAAVDLLRHRGAQFLVHCGDVGSERILDYLAGLPCAFVWGNCDWDKLSLARYAEQLKIPCYGAMGILNLDGKRAALLHGDDPRMKRAVLENQSEDYLFQGHTHIAADQRIGKVHLVNPGALHRAPQKTVALLNTASDEVEFLAVSLPS